MPSLFAYLPPSNDQQLILLTTAMDDTTKTDQEQYSLNGTPDPSKNGGHANHDNLLSRQLKKNPQLCAQYGENRYLSTEELDAINKQLIGMKFIRQNPEMKSITKRVKAETVMPDIEKRMRWLRFSPRRFFYLFWTELWNVAVTDHSDRLPSSLSASSNRVYTSSAIKAELGDFEYPCSDGCDDDHSESQPFDTFDGYEIEEEGSTGRNSQRRNSQQHQRRCPGEESNRYRRRKKDALATLECFSTSSLYHPYCGYTPPLVGPRVRVSNRGTYDRIMADEGYDANDDAGESKGPKVIIGDSLTCDPKEAEEMRRFFFSPLKQPFLAKKKKGRPRKDEIRIR